MQIATQVNVNDLISSDVDDPQDPLNVAWIQLARQYQEKYGDPECGRNRMVFLDEQWVYKLPRNCQGMSDNSVEAHWSSQEIPIAACSLTVEMPSGIPVLKMEWVTPTFARDLPDWTDWVDCQQVGYTTDGRLVAYDLGN